MSVKVNKTVHINYIGYLEILNLPTSSQKHKSLPKLMYTSTKSSVQFLITCYNLQVNLQRFDSRGVLNIQYCPSCFNSKTLHPCPSSQCDTARLESKLTLIQIMFISFLEFEHWFSNDAQRLVYEKQRSRTLLTVIDVRSVPECSLEALLTSPFPLPTLLTSVNFHFFSATYPFCSSTYFSHDDDDWPWRVFTRRRHDIIYTVLYKY